MAVPPLPPRSSLVLSFLVIRSVVAVKDSEALTLARFVAVACRPRLATFAGGKMSPLSKYRFSTWLVQIGVDVDRDDGKLKH